MKKGVFMKSLVFLLIIISIVACSKPQPQPTLREVINAETADLEERIPGTVDYTWEEPMQDTILVPAQLDPTGTYYRPAHKTVVEINEGRVQPVQYPDEE